jgi:hypothetical protein
MPRRQWALHWFAPRGLTTALLLGVGLVACGGSETPARPSPVIPRPQPTSTPVPTPQPTPPPIAFTVEGRLASQGTETVRIRANSSNIASFRLDLVPAGTGVRLELQDLAPPFTTRGRVGPHDSPTATTVLSLSVPPGDYALVLLNFTDIERPYVLTATGDVERLLN